MGFFNLLMIRRSYFNRLNNRSSDGQLNQPRASARTTSCVVAKETAKPPQHVPPPASAMEGTQARRITDATARNDFTYETATRRRGG